MNQYEKMATYLGVEMNRPFHVRVLGRDIYGSPYTIKENGIFNRGGNTALIADLGTMFSGHCDIEQDDDKCTFFYIDIDGSIHSLTIGDLSYSTYTDMKNFGNTFVNEESAIKYRDKIKELLNNRK